LLNYSHTEGFSLHHGRERNDEVDLVTEKKGKVIGLEVKNETTQSSAGITDFKKQVNPHKVLLASNSGIKWQDLLKMNPAELF